jgi:hypothetical protein
MSEGGLYRPLSDKQIELLKAQGCSAEDWSTVHGTIDFVVTHVHEVHFAGTVRLGRLSGHVTDGAGVRKAAGLYQAYVANCTVGDDARVANVRAHVSNYHIGAGAWVEDVGVIQAGPRATFGNGVGVNALNEGGGRATTMFNEMSSQFAYLHVVCRTWPAMTQKLQEMADAAAAAAAADHGKIGAGAMVCSVDRIADVAIGEGAVVRGAASLENGTILSSREAPTTIGAGVIARDFIVAEGSVVDDGAMLSATYVGQGCRVGKQFSAEGSLFFANCEAFHGEACSIFAGPYTVTHHKGTLLIAGAFSFYNAGSSTNQSNHMYKLGPVHEGKLERGCKTGSFSYMMWPCRVGPFSVVLGKHTRTFDLRDFPFSHVEAKADGRCEMVPGLYLTTVGTVRDGAKWPARDRRKGAVQRDLIHFPVLSPLTAGRMLRGLAKLNKLAEETPRTAKSVMVDGAEVRRVLLRTGAKYYQAGLEMYLLERLVSRVERARSQGEKDTARALAAAAEGVFSESWVDVGGQLMPRARFDRLCLLIETGEIASIGHLDQLLRGWHGAYEGDEWAWVSWAYPQVLGASPEGMSAAAVKEAAEQWKQVRTKFLTMILNDAGKEFDAATRTGFGVDGDGAEAEGDFAAVRGTLDENSFVRQIREEISEVTRRADAI